MCWWQRWALFAVLLFAGDALLLSSMAARRPALGPVVQMLGWAGLLAMAANAGIALFHAGVEQKWWQGITRCTAPPVAGDAGAMLADILAQPIVRCDAIPWSLFGVSMAGWNFIASVFLSGVALWLMLRR
jgi:disulfide bond formation protein DsbB